MTKREKNLLYIAGLVIVLAIYMMVVLPYIDLTAAKIEETQCLQTEITMQTKQLALLPDLRQTVEDNLTKIDEFKQCYGDLQTQESIATYFTQLAENQHLKVTSFSQTRTTQLLQSRGLFLYPSAEVTLTCRGSHADYIAMVDKMNQSNAITILSMHYTQLNAEPPINEYTLNCLLLMNADE